MENTENKQTLHAASRLIKEQARRSLHGNMGIAVCSTVVYVVLSAGLSLLAIIELPGSGPLNILLGYVVMFLCNILLGVLQYGLATIFMKLQYRQTTQIGDLFAGFRESSLQIIQMKAFISVLILLAQLPLDLFVQYASADTDLGYAIMIGVMCTLCALYLIFVFWLSLAYSMCWYILLDYPDMSWREVLHRSRMLMDGNKRVLFYLQLSLLPLYLVSLLTFGIAAFWVSAYQSAIEAAFYRGLMHTKTNH